MTTKKASMRRPRSFFRPIANIVIVTLGLVGGGGMAADQEMDNLIKNGGYEELTDGFPTAWNKYQTGEHWVMKVVADAQVKHAGEHSMRLESAEPVRGGVEQRNIPVQGGKTYQFAFWGRSEGVEGSREGGVVFFHFDQGARQHLDLTMLKGTQDWRWVTKQVQVPEKATLLRIQIELYNSKGKIWIDDVELKPLPQGASLGTGAGTPLSKAATGGSDAGRKNLLAAPLLSKGGAETPNPWAPLLKTDLPLFYVGDKRDKWVPEMGKPELTVDEQLTFEGKPSLRIRAADVAAGCWTQYVPVQGGHNYQFSARIKARDLESDDVGSAFFFVFDKGEKQHVDGPKSLKGPGEHDWLQVTKGISVPEGATRMGVFLGLYMAKGTLWFADPRLTIAGNGMQAVKDPLLTIARPLYRELLTDKPQPKMIIATTGKCVTEEGTPANVKADPRWCENMAEELLSARINGFLWAPSGATMEGLAKFGFKRYRWVGFKPGGLSDRVPQDLFSEENIRKFEERCRRVATDAKRDGSSVVIFGDEEEGQVVDIFYNDPDPLKRIAVREANAAKFIEVGRRFYQTVKGVDPKLPVVANNLCMIWSAIAPMDYSQWGGTGDYISFDAYPTVREAGRMGSANFMPGFGAKFLSDMTGKPVWGILQAFEYHRKPCTPFQVQEWVSQLFRNGGVGLQWYDHTYPHAPAGFVKYQAPAVWDMEKRMSWMVAGMPKVKLPSDSDTAVLYSQHSYAAKPGIPKEYWVAGAQIGTELYSAYSMIGPKVGNWLTFLCDRQLERKEKNLKEFRLLYLPLAKYETEPVAQQVRDFVKAGGVVVAGDPEVFSSDINGQDLSKYREEIFGVRLKAKDGRHDAEWQGNKLTFPPNQFGESVGWQVEVIDPEAEVIMQFGNKEPALIRRKLGNGTAWYFAANPFCPEILGNQYWQDVFRHIQEISSCRTDEPIWRFLIPSDQVVWDKPPKIDFVPAPAYLRNGGFEETIDEANWRLSSSGEGKATLDQTNPHSGKYCLRLACDSKTSVASATQTLSVKPNTDYILRLWYRFSGGTGPLKIYNFLGKTLWVEKITTEWTPIEFKLNSGNQARANLNLLHFQRDNTVWIDDVEFKEATD